MVGVKNRPVLKLALWVRLVYVFAVVFWVAVIIVGFVAGTLSDASKWAIPAAILFMFLVPALNANLMWFTYNDRGIEYHNPFRRPVFIQWDEINIINRVPMESGTKAWRIVGPEREIQITENLTGYNGLKQEIMQRVPDEKWSKG